MNLDPNSIFWQMVAQVSSSLAGFTLASFSIYVSRVQMVASDDICRRYSLKECTSHYSWYFMILTLINFSVPLFLSLVILIPELGYPLSSVEPYIRSVLTFFLMGILVIIIMSFTRQIDYVGKLWGSLQNQKHLKAEEINNAKNFWESRKWNWHSKIDSFRFWLKFFFYFFFVCCSIFILIIILLYIFGLLDKANPLLLTSISIFILPFSPETITALSLFFGLILLFWHIQIFNPENILFEIDEAARMTLIRVVGDINQKCQKFDAWQQLLLPMLRKPEESWVKYLMHERRLPRGGILMDKLFQVRTIEPLILG